MVISSEFCMGQYRDDGHRENAPRFIFRCLMLKSEPIAIPKNERMRKYLELRKVFEAKNRNNLMHMILLYQFLVLHIPMMGQYKSLASEP